MIKIFFPDRYFFKPSVGLITNCESFMRIVVESYVKKCMPVYWEAATTHMVLNSRHSLKTLVSLCVSTLFFANLILYLFLTLFTFSKYLCVLTSLDTHLF